MKTVALNVLEDGRDTVSKYQKVRLQIITALSPDREILGLFGWIDQNLCRGASAQSAQNIPLLFLKSDG